MPGLMMDAPLLIGTIVDHAARWHGDVEVVTQQVGMASHRYTYRELRERSAQLAHALRDKLGVRLGDRVATFAWNTYRHYEAYFGVSGIGAVLHTVNPRLFTHQVEYIVNHAADRYVLVDPHLVHLLEPLAANFPSVEAYVILTDEEHMPKTTLPNAICYETLIAGMPDEIVWPALDERAASSLCYTSGTTGNPKGVMYSHRSTVLHALSSAADLSVGENALDTVLTIVPMFHANAWGMPYLAPMIGSRMVFPDAHLDPARLYEIMESESVTTSLGVPTIWLHLIAYMKKNDLKFGTLKAIAVGGSAAPPALIEAFERDFNVQVLHAWGMTETSPSATTGVPKAKHAKTVEERIARKAGQGRVKYGVEVLLLDDAGKALPFDGVAQGDLLVRGPWVASGYYEDDEATAASITPDGWFRTGDIASIDADGYVTLRDRSKDVIKSGGEWISSIDLENVAIAHPGVAEAAAIGVPHPTWSERPVLVVVPKEGSAPTKAEMLDFLTGKVAKWWLPDDVLFVRELPHTATGKVSKKTLRERYAANELTA
ncbi:MAG: long-chain-fatty-acid--CoA ligase [Candidatus Eremiobacteraeota bacterium]|nr:long-chain-fatty-acid--CoA ligase [Candidatus Eremiobacteraeota bacterium]